VSYHILRFSRTRLCVPAAWLSTWLCLAADAAVVPCRPFTDEARNEVVGYLRKLSHLPAETTLDLTGSDPEGDTCYRKLEWQALNISATPTLFINCHRLVGVKTAAEIEEQIPRQIHAGQ
jgi:hypothetical protein